MLLRFFRINDPYRLLGVLVILILLALPFWLDAPALTRPELHQMIVGEAVANGQELYTEWWDSTPPVAAWSYGLFSGLFGRSMVGWSAVAFLILIFQASYFAWLLISARAYNENTFLPALVFVILSTTSFDFLRFSPELLGSLLLLFALRHVFNEIEFASQREEAVLKIGLFLGVATMIVFTYWVFFICAWLVLQIYARLSVRKILLLFTGFLLPHSALALWYFCFDETRWLWLNFYQPNFRFPQDALMSNSGLMWLGLLPGVYFLFSLFMLQREAHFTRYQSQLLQVMMLWLMFSFIQVLITGQRTPHSFYVLIPSLTYFISHYLLLIRRKWIANVTLILLLLGTIAIALVARYDKWTPIDYSNLVLTSSPETLVSDKQVMVLDEVDPAIFQNNNHAGFFYNWQLSSSIWDNPNDYESLFFIQRSLTNYPPDVIFDPKDKLGLVIPRLPDVFDDYQKEGDWYWRNSKADSTGR